jgi:hypothetical protein
VTEYQLIKEKFCNHVKMLKSKILHGQMLKSQVLHGHCLHRNQ